MKSFIFQDWGIRAILEGRKTMTRRLIKPEPLAYMFNVDLLKWSFRDWNEYHKCPYSIGDIVYMRETYAYLQAGIGIAYRADGDCRHKIIDNKWKSPLFMKEIEAREFLKITDIKVEQACDISEEDAKKEGVEQFNCPDFRTSFYCVWAELNGPDSWQKWVWAYEFEKVS
jgi:hypothetical protein